MECLVQMVSVRRTLFINEEERQQYLSNLMRMIMDILKSKKGTVPPPPQPFTTTFGYGDNIS